MSWRRPEQLCRWLVPATLLALTPKCVLCLLAYTGLATALRLGGPEFCGEAAKSPSAVLWPLLAAGALAATGVSFHRLFKRPTRTLP